MAFSYKEQTYGSVTLRSSRYFDIDYSTLDYTPLHSTTQLEADKYVSDVGDTFKVTVGVTELDRTASGNSTLWVVEPTSDRVSIDTQHSAFTALNVTNDSLIRLTRVSKKDAPYVDYANAAVLTEQDLDAQAKQSLHIVQESIDTANDALPLATDGKWDGKSKVIKNVATPTADSDAATKSYADGGAAGQSILANEDSIAKIGAGYDGTASTSGTNTNLTQINAVANDLVDINTVASADANITTIAARYDGTTDQTTGTNLNIANINTVATNIATISAKVSKSGDTMTGALTLSGAPTDTLHATTKTYVDTQDTTTQTNALSNSIVFSIALG